MESNVLDELNKRLASLPKDVSEKLEKLLKKAESPKDIKEDFELLGFKVDDEFAKAFFDNNNGSLNDEQLEQVAGGGEWGDLARTIGGITGLVLSQSTGVVISTIADSILPTIGQVIDKKLGI